MAQLSIRQDRDGRRSPRHPGLPSSLDLARLS
jgi:hypothetical protein